MITSQNDCRLLYEEGTKSFFKNIQKSIQYLLSLQTLGEVLTLFIATLLGGVFYTSAYSMD